ncbi:hypothetical protein AVEN_185184-1 [Araneus ventricosus]|uniref:Uncharacterized protein n=1 Tax=Araneus ventricosus TaxID=182803 RepID=A0A4Y2TN07_ARAVE|nr:hypothetical protein AVEN_271369-1 [Araneus ventricosus]GBO02030.1 hypothetical protein AVEN_14403-1 [Araneus ventricosus]GBO03715.1 hypothetical protein AVEN_193900-1 [Araneus ventricosus]GBO03729.1 hypothetical protein AVEN_185184-1 [Araneus ventricosus]
MSDVKENSVLSFDSDPQFNSLPPSEAVSGGLKISLNREEGVNNDNGRFERLASFEGRRGSEIATEIRAVGGPIILTNAAPFRAPIPFLMQWSQKRTSILKFSKKNHVPL